MPAGTSACRGVSRITACIALRWAAISFLRIAFSIHPDQVKISMRQTTLGEFGISALGLGCMNLSHGYGPPSAPDASAPLLERALDLGYSFFDTATIYGAGANEELVGETLSHRRDEFVLASKCGLFPRPDGGREIDGRPERIKQACEDSLKRLKTDVIDLYYLHRLDRDVPIEESAGAFGDLIAQGKIRSYGLSEVSAPTLRRAHAEQPVTAVQGEYSLWTRNPEIGVLAACTDLGVAFVAFSPLGRGFLTGTLDRDKLNASGPGDMRRSMPRFSPSNFPRNLEQLAPMRALAAEREISMAELALAWVLAKAPGIIAIPGTTDPQHLAQNAKAADLDLGADAMERLENAINPQTIHGARYNAAQQADIDTEEFAPHA